MKYQGTMYKNVIYAITIAVLLLSCKGNSSKGTVADKPLLAINPAEFVEKSFNLSDFADSIVFIELSPDYPFSGKVEQITSDRMIVYDRYKSFKYFDRQGKILGEIGRVGQGADEYLQNSAYCFIAFPKCFYDNRRNLYAVYSDIPTKRGLRLKYYDHQGEYYGSIRLNTPYQDKGLPHIFFSEGYFYLLAYPSTLNTEDAVLCFDNKGNLVREYSYDANRTCFSRGVEMPTNYYRDHLLLWGFNDTIYEVRGRECTPVYRWDIPQDMRRKLEERDFKNMGVGAVQDNEFSPHLILDTKKWLIVHGYIIPSFHYYYYNKEEGKWYGDSAPNNDLGYYTFGNAMCFFDGYYYDEKKDEEWLYHTFSPGDRLLDLLEETDDPRSIAMRKELSEKDDINPILVMVRLKK